MVLASVLSFATMAEEAESPINYDYIQGGFVNLELTYGGDSIDFDFAGVGASTSVSENINLFGGVITDMEDGGDLTITAIGLGYHTPISSTTDLQLSAAYDRYEASASGATASASGNTIAVGLATALSDSTELSIAYVRPSIEGESASGFAAGAVLDINKNLSVVGDVTSISESGVTANLTAASLRYNF